MLPFLPYNLITRIRNIVAKFTYFKDREMVRREWKHLSGTGCQMFEKFPPEVVEKRRNCVTFNVPGYTFHNTPTFLLGIRLVLSAVDE
ncbi:hypothetical protein DPMN_055980 [Dreissena polymorpha]|uniref:Uncharacterized protein n=1 Tax=Dreissena polymorpha TaxID=45954 RepID=A0A9D4HT29_DREPO|nr:hypothetical protein DPMN_055980 [Dreissena polymorpha]